MNNLEWPAEGVTRAPYRVMADPDIYALEQERIFRGPVWHYLCMEAELPEPGTFRTASIGDTPVIVTRDRDGVLHGLVNRCAHKGALVCPEAGGQAQTLTCLYHAWSYDLAGNLSGVPFHRGVNGQGGMPEDFDFAGHGLESFSLAAYRGLVFGTFAAVEPLEDYLGPAMTAHLRRVFHKPVEVLGYYHQALQNNWKLYMENSRDPYHATILHAFYATFKLNRLTMDGGITIERDGWHSMNFSKGATLREGGEYGGSGMRNVVEDVGLADPALIARRQEFPDGITVAIQSIFPTCVHQQIYNTLALRRVAPLGPERCELHWTVFGYTDDDPELRQMRLTQANLIGPAGYVSIDDGVIGEYVQRGIGGTGMSRSAVMEMGGRSVESTTGSRATEATLRGFWTGYRALMGL